MNCGKGEDMALIRTGFDPQNNGFRFANRFELDIFSRVQLPIITKASFGELIYGLCGGMCFTALDYFHAGRLIPSVSRVGDIHYDLFSSLWERQMDSLQSATLFKLAKWMVYADSTLAHRVAKEESAHLRDQIDHGEPVVLALVRVRGFNDPTQNHQVMAVAYKFEPTTLGLEIHLYDPNYPGQTPKLSMNFSKPSQGIDLRQSTGEPLRGFFIIPYVRKLPS
jgi:hypothetical protein